MNIIFICKHNVFRSRVAESYFAKTNRNKNIHVSSGGLIVGEILSINQKKVMKELNVEPISRPKNVSARLLKKQDLVVVVANDVPEEIFNNKMYIKKVIFWKIPDVFDNSKEKPIKVIKSIMKKVNGLVKSLEDAR